MVVVFFALSVMVLFHACCCIEKFKLCRMMDEGECGAPYECLAIEGVLHNNLNNLTWRDENHSNTILWIDGMKSPIKRQGIFRPILTAVSLVDPVHQMRSGGRLLVKDKMLNMTSPPSDPHYSSFVSSINTVNDDDPGDCGMASLDPVVFFCPPLDTCATSFALNEYFYVKGDVSKVYITETLCLSKSPDFRLVNCTSPEAVTCQRKPVEEAFLSIC